ENKQITFDELKDITENKKTIMTDNIYDYSCKFYEQKQFDEFIQKMKKDNNLFIYSNKNVKITASSHLSTGNSNYMESNMMDGDLKTIWVEGAKDFGFKEWVKISSNFNKIFFPHYLIIYSGHGKNYDLFKKNNRLKSIVMRKYNPCGTSEQSYTKRFPVTYFFRYTLEDKPGYHVLPIGDVYMDGCPGKPIEITLYIESVYPGSMYDDTCISELQVLGEAY
nr:hypothetical protein [Spirochaetota bacterium]